MNRNSTLKAFFVGEDAEAFAEAADALAGAGHKVERIASPLKALTAHTRSPADLMVISVGRLDDQMLEVFEAAREVAPDCLMLGAVGPATRRRAAPVLGLGADAIVGTPVDPDELRALIARHGRAGARTPEASVEEKFRWLGDFAAGVAHHINNPLTTVVGYLQLLRSEEELPEDAGEVLSTMLTECDRIADTVRYLLLLSGRANVRPEAVDVNQVIGSAIEASSADDDDEAPEVEIEQSLQPDLPAILAEEEALKRACENLIANARQAMSEGGTLEITTAGDNGRVFIRFADTGDGIDPDRMARIFEPFYTTQDDGPAMGLGLATAYGIVKGFGGTIQAQSQPGQGSTFTIEFPAHS